MAITSSDIKIFLTGAASDGAAQADAAASLGNYRSSTEITSASDNNLFDDTSGAEAAAGDTEYRCYCIKNEHASLELTTAAVFISTATGNAQNVISIAVESPTTSNTTGNAQTIVNGSTTPTVNSGNCSAWSTASTYATGVSVAQGAHDANIGVGEIMFVWVKRAVTAGAAAADAEQVSIRVQGDSSA